MAALELDGARLLVERLRFEWRHGAPFPPARGSLAFRPPLGDAEVVELMTSAVEGTLDAHDRRDLERLSRSEVAVRHFEGELATYESPRSWWRIAERDGVPVGFVLPAQNDYSAIIAYLGVLPEHRGRGYVHDLLAEGTRVLSCANVPRIRASTDVSNVPMARAFEAAGWQNFERLLTMTWDVGRGHR